MEAIIPDQAGDPPANSVTQKETHLVQTKTIIITDDEKMEDKTKTHQFEHTKSEKTKKKTPEKDPKTHNRKFPSNPIIMETIEQANNLGTPPLGGPSPMM